MVTGTLSLEKACHAESRDVLFVGILQIGSDLQFLGKRDTAVSFKASCERVTKGPFLY